MEVTENTILENRVYEFLGVSTAPVSRDDINFFAQSVEVEMSNRFPGIPMRLFSEIHGDYPHILVLLDL